MFKQFIKTHKEEPGHSLWHKNVRKEEGHLRVWKSKRPVWFQHNDDSKLGANSDGIISRERQTQLEAGISPYLNPKNKYKRTQEQILEELNSEI